LNISCSARDVRFHSIAKLMTAATAIGGLLPILLLRMHGTEIERP
jgi:Cu/Ag efflux pump CusA